VVAGGPAAKAGIKAGDHILAVDGESVESLDLPSLRMEIANKVSRKQLPLKNELGGHPSQRNGDAAGSPLISAVKLV